MPDRFSSRVGLPARRKYPVGPPISFGELVAQKSETPSDPAQINPVTGEVVGVSWEGNSLPADPDFSPGYSLIPSDSVH